MLAVMQRLQREIPLNPALKKLDSNTMIWQLSEELPRQNIEFFRKGILRHSLLTLEYSVLCTQLMHDYQQGMDEEHFTNHLVCALMMAEYLTYLYRFYLNVPREVERLQTEQKVYRSLLEKRGYVFSALDFVEIEADSFSQRVRSLTIMFNVPRLFSGRIKRVLEMSAPFVRHMDTYSHFIKDLNKVAKPFFGYMAWIFFLPRLLVNLFLLLKHLIPGSWWMDEKEIKLGWLYRLQAQLQRRWFELANDSVWLVAGLLACFVWTGPLAVIGVYINAVLYVYDVGTAAVRAAIEINRLKKLAEEYELMYHNANEDDRKQIANFQKHLARRIAYEQKKLLLSVINTSVLAIAIMTTLPFAAVNPLIPLIGAVALVLITILAFAALKWLESQKPIDKIGFFNEPCTGSRPSLSHSPTQIVVEEDLGSATL